MNIHKFKRYDWDKSSYKNAKESLLRENTMYARSGIKLSKQLPKVCVPAGSNPNSRLREGVYKNQNIWFDNPSNNKLVRLTEYQKLVYDDVQYPLDTPSKAGAELPGRYITDSDGEYVTWPDGSYIDTIHHSAIRDLCLYGPNEGTMANTVTPKEKLEGASGLAVVSSFNILPFITNYQIAQYKKMGEYATTAEKALEILEEIKDRVTELDYFALTSSCKYEDDVPTIDNVWVSETGNTTLHYTDYDSRYSSMYSNNLNARNTIYTIAVGATTETDPDTNEEMEVTTLYKRDAALMYLAKHKGKPKFGTKFDNSADASNEAELMNKYRAISHYMHRIGKAEFGGTFGELSYEDEYRDDRVTIYNSFTQSFTKNRFLSMLDVMIEYVEADIAEEEQLTFSNIYNGSLGGTYYSDRLDTTDYDLQSNTVYTVKVKASSSASSVKIVAYKERVTQYHTYYDEISRIEQKCTGSTIAMDVKVPDPYFSLTGATKTTGIRIEIILDVASGDHITVESVAVQKPDILDTEVGKFLDLYSRIEYIRELDIPDSALTVQYAFKISNANDINGLNDTDKASGNQEVKDLFSILTEKEKECILAVIGPHRYVQDHNDVPQTEYAVKGYVLDWEKLDKFPPKVQWKVIMVFGGHLDMDFYVKKSKYPWVIAVIAVVLAIVAWYAAPTWLSALSVAAATATAVGQITGNTALIKIGQVLGYITMIMNVYNTVGNISNLTKLQALQYAVTVATTIQKYSAMKDLKKMQQELLASEEIVDEIKEHISEYDKFEKVLRFVYGENIDYMYEIQYEYDSMYNYS
jgi:hypothetical protein